MKRISDRTINTNKKHHWLNRRPFGSGSLLIALMACTTSVGVAIEVQGAEIPTATLVMAGDVIPGGNGTFQSFEPVQILNANGEVAFIGKLAGTPSPSTDAAGIYLANTQTVAQLVRTGQTAPDGNGTFNYFAADFNTSEALTLNDHGSIAFTASLNGTSGGQNDSVGLFGASVADGVKQFLRTSDAAPGGNGVFTYDPPPTLPGLDNLGNALFYGRLDGTSGGQGVDDNGAFRSDGATVTPLARAGDVAPGETDTFGMIFPSLASNLSGQVAISLDMSFDEPEPAQLPPPPGGLQRIYISTGENLNEVVRDGMPVSNAEGALGSFGYSQLGPRIADNGNIVFEGSIAGLGLSSLFEADGVNLTEIARVGDRPPGEDLFSFEYFLGLANNNEQVVFAASLYRNAVPPNNRSSGIYLWNGESLTTLVRQGDAAPGGNGTFGDVAKPLFLNSSGEIVFSATLTGTADSVNDTRGIFFIDSNGAIHEVARFGKPLEGSTVTLAFYVGDYVNSFFLDDSALSLAGMNAINDSGQVVFLAALADGRSGIFLWNATNAGPDPETIFENGFE